MHIINIIGGLGNQMFQYSFFRAMNQRFNDCKIDVSGFNDYDLHNGYELERIFDISPQRCTDEEKKQLSNSGTSLISRAKRFLVGRKKTEYIENGSNYDPIVFQKDSPNYFDGYWQSEKYFKNIENIIREDFTFKLKMTEQNEIIKQEMLNSNSISIHVRRGDYIGNALYEGICDVDYYKKSILLMKSKVDNPTFFVFSNDLEWCKNNLEMLGNQTVYVEGNTAENSYQDMQLMSFCRHNIIANSSFSWWGAWLNGNKDKIVISPKRWFNEEDKNSADMIPAEWIRV